MGGVQWKSLAPTTKGSWFSDSLNQMQKLSNTKGLRILNYLVEGGGKEHSLGLVPLLQTIRPPLRRVDPVLTIREVERILGPGDRRPKFQFCSALIAG